MITVQIDEVDILKLFKMELLKFHLKRKENDCYMNYFWQVITTEKFDKKELNIEYIVYHTLIHSTIIDGKIVWR